VSSSAVIDRDTHLPLTNRGMVAKRLWDALLLARSRNLPCTKAAVEDAIFRFYLPQAHTLAREAPGWPTDPGATQQAAELSLAQAVLAWAGRDSQEFEDFARTTISCRLRRLCL